LVCVLVWGRTACALREDWGIRDVEGRTVGAFN